MKLWQKLYVVLIIPILLILNIAIYLLFGITIMGLKDKLTCQEDML